MFLVSCHSGYGAAFARIGESDIIIIIIIGSNFNFMINKLTSNSVSYLNVLRIQSLLLNVIGGGMTSLIYFSALRFRGDSICIGFECNQIYF